MPSPRKVISLFALAVLAASTAVCGRAQESAPPAADTTAPAAAAAGPQLRPSPTLAMRSIEPAETEEYVLGPGDEISVDVPGRPELTGKHVVGPDGRISMPVAGVVSVNNMTRDQAGTAIAQSLSQYYAAVSATVAIDKYAGNRVLVLGNVEHPGVLVFDATPTLLEAISRAGLTQQRDKPMGVPERIAIYRGNDQVIWVDLRALLEKGTSIADLRLRKNDLIYVPSDADRTVSVLGDVQHPGSVHLTSTSTLPQVLADAGGINQHAGTNPTIQIIDPATGKTRTLKYHDILTPSGALEISLQPGQIIFVPTSKFYQASYILERLNPAMSAMTMYSFMH